MNPQQPEQSRAPEPGTSLVPVIPSGDQLPAVEEKFVEDASVEASDIVLPALKLLQGQSPEVLDGPGKPGNFWDSLQEKMLIPPIRCVIAWHGKSRFKPEGKPPDTALCTSADTVHGRTYGLCKDCGYKEWGEAEPGERRNPPACSLDQLFVLLTDAGLLAVRFRKKAEKYAKQFITQRQMSGKNWWAYQTMLRVSQETGQDQQGKPTKYFAPKITWLLAEVVPEPLRIRARQLHDALQAAAEANRLSTTGEEDDTGGAEA